MKKLFIILIFSVVFATLNAAVISGRLKAEIIAKNKVKNGAHKSNLIKFAPSMDYQIVFLHFTNKPTYHELNILKKNNVKIFTKTWIPPCKNHPTGFLVAIIPADIKSLEKIGKLSFIKRINSAERIIQLHNDIAANETGVSNVTQPPYNLSGEGVKIAVIDSGFEIDNPDLPEPIIAIDYSNYIAQPDSDFTVSNETTHTGHGTHVAGTILGQGTASNGVWKGMAPNADFIAIKVAHDNSGAIFIEPLIHSIYAASFYYNADLINISLGGWDEYHDGSSEDCQVVDLVYENGTICFISTGNDSDDDFHYSNTIAPMDISDFIAINYNDTTSCRDINYDINLVWHDSDDPEIQDELDMLFYNNNFQPLAIQNIQEMTQSPRGTQSRFGTATVFGHNTFYVRILNQSNNPQKFHLFIESHNGKFAIPDSNYTIASPAVADKAVSIGAYCSRIEWVNWQGLPVSMLYSVLYDLAPYSNRGPRIDEVLKPTLTAPGTGLISVRDNDAWGGPPFGVLWDPFVISNSYAQGDENGGLPADYIYLTGTSMACPAACGSAALLKEFAPNLTTDEFVNLLKENAIDDEFTLNTPNNEWGFGKINISNAIANLESTENTLIGKNIISNIQNFPNPFNPETHIQFILSKEMKIKVSIYNLKGEFINSIFNGKLTKGHNSIFWDGTDQFGKKVSSGIYFYKIQSKDQIISKKMLLLK